MATEGTRKALEASGIRCERVNKVGGGRLHIVDLIENREFGIVDDTPFGQRERPDDPGLLASATHAHILCITPLARTRAMTSAQGARHRGKVGVRRLQDHRSFAAQAHVVVRSQGTVA